MREQRVYGKTGLRRLQRVLLLVLAFALTLGLGWAVAGCGSDEETTSTAVVTSAGGETTTSATVAPSSTVPSQTTLTSTVSPAATTSSTEAPTTTTTEALSSAEIRLPNGNIKGMGYIDAVWESDGRRYLSIDYAEMLSGQEAVDAAVAAGYIQPGEDLPNDYFIRNESTKKREFTVAASTVITTATFGGGAGEEPATWTEFVSFWSDPPAGGEHLSEMPWWIERAGDTVVAISEQYLP